MKLLNLQCSESAKLSVEDAKTILKNNVRKRWSEMWKNEPLKNLRKLKTNINKFVIPTNMKREDLCKITRLRLGHTKVTHQHLFQQQSHTLCDTCNQSLNVEHIIIYCTKYDQERRKHNINNINILNETNKFKDIIQYLQETNLYNEL